VAAKSCIAVVNADDPHAEDVSAAARRGGMRVRRYGSPAAVGGTRRRRAHRRHAETDRAHAHAHRPGRGRRARAHVPSCPCSSAQRMERGGFLHAARALGSWTAARPRGLEQSHGVPGRLERVDGGQPFVLVVDLRAHARRARARTRRLPRARARARAVGVRQRGRPRPRQARSWVQRPRASGPCLVTNDNPRSAGSGAEIRGGAQPARPRRASCCSTGGRRSPRHRGGGPGDVCWWRARATRPPRP
jgi:hypothetical protein